MHREPYLFVIVMMHLTYAAAVLCQRRDTKDEAHFANMFAISWIIEAIRAAILLPAVRGIALRDTEWYAISDVLCPIATCFLLAACAFLTNAKLPKRLGAIYIVSSIPLLLFARYGLPFVGDEWFGLSTTDASFYGVFGILLILFIPATIARIAILYWLYGTYRETRLSGAFIAAAFSIPYGLMAIAVPFQFCFNYYPDWLLFFWVFRVFGFSIGLVMLRLSLRQAQLYQLNNELDLRIERRTAELQDKNEELDMFSQTISHDLGQPLSAMKMFASALQHQNNLSPSANECVTNICEAINMTETMIKDLLSYSQIACDELNLEPVDMNSMVELARKQLQTAIAESNASVEMAPDLPTVRGHETILIQIIANLISNGLKFANESPPEIRIFSENRSGRHRIWVCDNGVGIAASHLDLIFDPFQRLDNETFKGSGMGLAIVRRGCERIGGRCGVESEHGNGSRFWIECADASTPPRHHLHVAAGETAGSRRPK